MSDAATANVDVEALVRRIRDEVRRRRAARTEGDADVGAMLQPLAPAWRDSIGEPGVLPRMDAAEGTIERKQRYALADFLRFHDADFICNAYRGVLRREPDTAGHGAFLEALRAGRLSQTEILGRLRYSREGRAAAVPIRGLAFAFGLRSIRRAPVIGRVLGIAQYLIRLPDIARNHERLEAVLFHRHNELAGAVNALATAVDNRQARVEASIGQTLRGLDAMLHALSGRQDTLASVTGQLREQQPSLALRTDVADDVRRLEAAAAAATDLLHDVLARLRTEQAKEWGRLAEALAQSGETQAALALGFETLRDEYGREAAARDDLARAATAENLRLDGFYAEFHDRFRGSWDDIRNRVAVYLPTFRAALAGTDAAPILDLGCGRGELIDLLRENRLVARGVDHDIAMVEDCRGRRLDVVRGDAIDYLRELPTGSLGAVAGMHVIEHFPFRQLLVLLDETRRVLRRGGVAVFETPNPENLSVGACTFWHDPTHVKPLPPELMQFVMESCGFVRTEIVRLHPAPQSRHLTEGPRPIRDRLNEVLYGWQDYALIAFKA